MLVGIYFSALSVCNNIILRRSIKKSLESEKQLFLLDRIGTRDYGTAWRPSGESSDLISSVAHHYK
jgi:hypothetical protein